MGGALELAFRRAAGRLIDLQKRWLVAVSGGGDSVALLHLMERFLDRPAEHLVVAHLDHALRRGSRTDRTSGPVSVSSKASVKYSKSLSESVAVWTSDSESPVGARSVVPRVIKKLVAPKDSSSPIRRRHFDAGEPLTRQALLLDRSSSVNSSSA